VLYQSIHPQVAYSISSRPLQGLALRMTSVSQRPISDSAKASSNGSPLPPTEGSDEGDVDKASPGGHAGQIREQKLVGTSRPEAEIDILTS